MSRLEKRLEGLEGRYFSKGCEPVVIWTILVSPDPDEETERTYSVDVIYQTPGKNARMIRGETEAETAFAARVERYLNSINHCSQEVG
jgi:hypothetical protein